MKVCHFEIRLIDKHLAEDQNHLNSFLESIDFVKSDCHFIESVENYWSVLVHYKDRITQSKTNSIANDKCKFDESDLNHSQKAVYLALKEWRSELAQEKNMPSYTICHNSELLNIVVQKPNSMSDFRKIKGFGNVKIEKYGNEILNILNAN